MLVWSKVLRYLHWIRLNGFARGKAFTYLLETRLDVLSDGKVSGACAGQGLRFLIGTRFYILVDGMA